MSPVERSGHHAGRAALVALVGVVVLFGTLGLVSVALSGRNSPDLQLGDQTFRVGRAETLADRIAETGPRLYADVSGRKDRDMILQHLGDDPDTGWSAFLAAPVDQARDCTWEWQADEELFRAACDETLTAPADGSGLPQFKVTVVDGQLDVDLNADARTDEDGSSTTTSTPVSTGNGPRSVEISRSQYGSRWPFSLDTGTLECITPGKNIVFRSGGTTYALNGNALGRASDEGWSHNESILLDAPVQDELSSDPAFGPMKMEAEVEDVIRRGLDLC